MRKISSPPRPPATLRVGGARIFRRFLQFWRRRRTPRRNRSRSRLLPFRKSRSAPCEHSRARRIAHPLFAAALPFPNRSTRGPATMHGRMSERSVYRCSTAPAYPSSRDAGLYFRSRRLEAGNRETHRGRLFPDDASPAVDRLATGECTPSPATRYADAENSVAQRRIPD